jgi:hypothetical protein
MNRGRVNVFRVLAVAATALATASAGTTRDAGAALPQGNTVAQWNKIAEDIVVGSGTNLPEGFPYMAYVSAAVYDAVVAIDGGFEAYGPAIDAPAGASVERGSCRGCLPDTMGLLPARSVQPRLGACGVRVLPASAAKPGRVLRAGALRDS